MCVILPIGIFLYNYSINLKDSIYVGIAWFILSLATAIITMKFWKSDKIVLPTIIEILITFIACVLFYIYHKNLEDIVYIGIIWLSILIVITIITIKFTNQKSEKGIQK
jgi:Na+/glutamate symporter